jgi:hypothetical protein
VERVIRGFHQDADGEWVAELECGHVRHVRHRPPFQDWPWVHDDAARAARVGQTIECGRCEEGGDPACWAGLVCPVCGGADAHRSECAATR